MQIDIIYGLAPNLEPPLFHSIAMYNLALAYFSTSLHCLLIHETLLSDYRT